LRYYAQFPLFNYGFIPQTWEQNLTKDALGLYVYFQLFREMMIQLIYVIWVKVEN